MKKNQSSTLIFFILGPSQEYVSDHLELTGMVEEINILGPDLRARVGLRKKLGLADLRTCIKGSQEH